MRALAVSVSILAVIALSVALALGLPDVIARQAVGMQREAQDALAGALRALRSGQPGAVIGFLTLCFMHGFLHAIGPGHGKAVIAAYGAASGAGVRWMAGLAALSSLGQALVAIALVYGAVWLLDGARDRIEELAAYIEPFSFALVAGLGLMLVWRGLRRLRPAKVAHHHHHHDHDCSCGHSHAPDPQALAAAKDWREVAVLVLGVALRPCTSALFLLILTWRLGLDALGIIGALVMGVGTMAVTGTAGIGAALMRRGVLLSLPEGGAALRPITAMIELLFGFAIAVIAGSVLIRLL
ncbi:high-affinity nickel-transporter (plasmid) [Ketogulonicigenium vulgare Y25]|uniref:nickel/cobalt transporter n=1 Tax=Ketogulonicigenium vulgare TaxID=92945 RepID=UPI0001E66F5C|nr:high frequency lysogenization protein HflD [Ketogulonicigenium vulgare]ADO44281.1 high-affinity nickel-transporter [Ketogulonicigenium vulgare Y25]